MGAAIHRNFQAEASASPSPSGAASVGVASIAGGRVLTSSGAVIGADDCLIIDVSDTFMTADVRANRHLAHVRLPRLIDTPEAVGVLTTYRSDIYYHWLLDTLPRLHLIRDAGISVDRFVVPQKHAFQRDSLAGLGVHPDEVIQDDGFQIRARTLVVPTLPGRPGHSPPWASEFLRRSFLPAQRSRSSARRRVYVSRARSGTRIISNEDEVLRVLERVGFERVFLEDLCFGDQVDLFNHAEVVVSPHGSGLANLVFCRPGAHVIELFSPEYVNVMYWLLAEQLGINYHHLVGRSRPTIARHRGRVHENITVDVCQLEETLRSGLGIR